MASGNVELNGIKLQAGDGASIEDEGLLKLSADSDAHLLLFDLA